jgi:phage/plasmid-associated DNA primase
LSSNFKQLTGGDMVPITNKYEKAYSAYLDTKIIITTNRNLMITSQDSDLRRCIFVKFRKDKRRLENFEEILFQERNGILLKCQQKYLELTQNNSEIKCDIQAAKDGARDFEVEFETIFKNYFIIEEGAKTQRCKVWEICQKYKFNPNRYSDFKEWFLRTKNLDNQITITEMRKRENGEQNYYFMNLKLRSEYVPF